MLTELSAWALIIITLLFYYYYLDKWGMSPTSHYSFCLLFGTLLHIVSGCNTNLIQGRYTWRHGSIPNFLALSFQFVRDSIIYADLSGFIKPSAITGDNLRPDRGNPKLLR